MWGQWIGTATGSISGNAILNIDEDMREFWSIELHYASDCKHPIRPFSISVFNIEVTGDSFTAEAIPVIGPDAVKEPKRSRMTGKLDQYKHIVATFDEGTYGTTEFRLFYQEINIPLPGTRVDWETFKSRVSTPHFDLLHDAMHIYRGYSSNKFCLRTSFHRCNKRSLRGFLVTNLRTLYYHLGPFLSREYRLDDNEDIISLLYIAQHHGFPTPFLDWTESPFVAAYFAYHTLDRYREYGDDDFVRVYAFDRHAWTRRFKNPRILAHVPAQLSILKPQVSNNDRAIPQQSIVTYSNLVNIDAYVATMMPRGHAPYLTAMDLPATQRVVVMAELRQMGITHASLFPGIEGTCIALKERLM